MLDAGASGEDGGRGPALERAGGRASMGRVELAPGAVVGGRYRILGPLGQGAIATVFEALSLGRALAAHAEPRVALKIMSRARLADPSSVAWFIHEALLGMTLDHPGLVRVLDYGRIRNRLPFYAMELCPGETLEDTLTARRRLPPATALSLLRDVASALEYLHHHGIVHRDVKPANLMVCAPRRGRPRLRLIDLGVAGVFDAGRASALGAEDVGASGTWGTPVYIAPEQALGHPVGPAADVYALACVAYRMLTGRDALRGRTVSSTVRAHLLETAPPASRWRPALGHAVDEVFARALDKHAARRTPSAARFVAELTAALRAARAS